MFCKMMDTALRFIGRVRSEVKERKAMPAFGAPATVELFPEFSDGLWRIEKHSHLWVFAWLMDRPERDLLQVTPRGVSPDAPDAAHGVFAVRSPARPNPIGLTAARVIRREGLVLAFDRLDFMDGTPVVDLKPYFASRDLIFCASNASIGRPRDREGLVESLLIQALNFAPTHHPDVDLAVALLADFRIETMDWKEPAEWSVVAPAARPHIIDGLIGMTRVSFTRGLSLWDRPVVSINGREFSV